MGSLRILHADVDAFAVGVARRLDPSLERRPVIVGNDAGGRGVVASASWDVRARGVAPGMPLSLARRRAPEAVLVPESPLECERASTHLFDLLRDRAPVVEAASVDDFFLDLTGCERLLGNSLLRWSSRLRRIVQAELGLTLSMGIASNKMAARIATALAKTGHVIEVAPGAERDFIAPVSAGLLPGVGRETQARLRECGVWRIGQLFALGEEYLHMVFGARGSELWRRAGGQFDEPVRPTALHRYVCHEHAFAPDTADIHRLESAAALLAQRLASSLRGHGVRTSKIELTLVYGDALCAVHSARLDYPSDQDFDMVEPVRGALRAAFRRRVRVRTIRLRAPYVPGRDGQFDLFSEERQARRRGLYDAIDAVRRRHGFASIVVARALPPAPPADPQQ